MSKENEPTFVETGGSVHYLPDRMTLRQWYAGMALQNMVEWYITSINRTEMIAKEAIAFSDAMIAELERTKDY